VVNLDPAAEVFKYKPAVDIRDLISLEDAMDAMNFGPNGGLVFCMEYLTQNFGWFEEQIVGSFGEDYILIDCPGQIELYIHLPVLKNGKNQWKKRRRRKRRMIKPFLNSHNDHTRHPLLREIRRR